MPNGHMIVNEMDFEKQMKCMSDRELSEFTARTLYDHCENERGLADKVSLLENGAMDRESRLKVIEGGNKKVSAISGGITAGIISGILFLIEFFKSR